MTCAIVGTDIGNNTQFFRTIFLLHFVICVNLPLLLRTIIPLREKEKASIIVCAVDIYNIIS